MRVSVNESDSRTFANDSQITRHTLNHKNAMDSIRHIDLAKTTHTANSINYFTTKNIKSMLHTGQEEPLGIPYGEYKNE